MIPDINTGGGAMDLGSSASSATGAQSQSGDFVGGSIGSSSASINWTIVLIVLVVGYVAIKKL